MMPLGEGGLVMQDVARHVSRDLGLAPVPANVLAKVAELDALLRERRGELEDLVDLLARDPHEPPHDVGPVPTPPSVFLQGISPVDDCHRNFGTSDTLPRLIKKRKAVFYIRSGTGIPSNVSPRSMVATNVRAIARRCASFSLPRMRLAA